MNPSGYVVGTTRGTLSLVYLPTYMIDYMFEGVLYHALVNAVNSKVVGSRPTSRTGKIANVGLGILGKIFGS